ncbi:hypothetical protein BJV78DRAFT_613619 [Lactifluus subvellereus]|nr:hypothetical protein BJV78DRAFT_613619 [Lactifluus subvellereus]
MTPYQGMGYRYPEPLVKWPTRLDNPSLLPTNLSPSVPTAGSFNPESYYPFGLSRKHEVQPERISSAPAPLAHGISSHGCDFSYTCTVDPLSDSLYSQNASGWSPPSSLALYQGNGLDHSTLRQSQFHAPSTARFADNRPFLRPSREQLAPFPRDNIFSPDPTQAVGPGRYYHYPPEEYGECSVPFTGAKTEEPTRRASFPGGTPVYRTSSGQAPGIHFDPGHGFMNPQAHRDSPVASSSKKARRNEPFQSQSHVHRHTAAVSSIAPKSVVDVGLDLSRHWCCYCGPSRGFQERKALNRHMKDAHSRLNACVYPDCGFKFSQGRRYLYINHLRKQHQVPAPCSRRALRSAKRQRPAAK